MAHKEDRMDRCERTGGLWNTFVTVSHADAFLKLLSSTVLNAVAEVAGALARDDLDSAYRDLDMIDFSKDVRSLNPRQFPAPPDERVIETLAQNQIEPEWLRKMRGPHIPPASENGLSIAE
jgi:hypothetical protein